MKKTIISLVLIMMSTFVFGEIRGLYNWRLVIHCLRCEDINPPVVSFEYEGYSGVIEYSETAELDCENYNCSYNDTIGDSEFYIAYFENVIPDGIFRDYNITFYDDDNNIVYEEYMNCIVDREYDYAEGVYICTDMVYKINNPDEEIDE